MPQRPRGKPPSMPRIRHATVLAATTLVVLVVLAGCGSSSNSTTTKASGGSTTSSTAAAAASATVQVQKTSLGEVLTDGRGRTLYMFMKDTGGKSACNAGC